MREKACLFLTVSYFCCHADSARATKSPPPPGNTDATQHARRSVGNVFDASMSNRSLAERAGVTRSKMRQSHLENDTDSRRARHSTADHQKARAFSTSSAAADHQKARALSFIAAKSDNNLRTSGLEHQDRATPFSVLRTSKSFGPQARDGLELVEHTHTRQSFGPNGNMPPRMRASTDRDTAATLNINASSLPWSDRTVTPHQTTAHSLRRERLGHHARMSVAKQEIASTRGIPADS